MKHLISLSILLLAFLSLSAFTDPDLNDAKRGTILGKVLDANLKQPLPYVNVIVQNEKGETLTGGITLDDGSFKIEKIEEGTVNVSITYIGYKTYNKSVTLKRGNYKIDLGEIYLEEQLEDLDAVTVVAEVSTIQQKVDRKVINVGKDLANMGTATEIMSAVPSITVDTQTGDISLRGNQNVQVMVDGKLSNVPTAQLLKNYPPTLSNKLNLLPILQLSIILKV